MAKKVSIKEKREAEKAKKREEFREKNRISEQKKREEEKDTAGLTGVLNYNDPDVKRSKSKAKAAGLKSTFVLNNDKLLMTSFGRGSEAIPEKYVDKGVVQDINKEVKITVSPKEKGFQIAGRQVKDASTDNPLAKEKKKVGQDLIYLKDKLEIRYFGEEFEDNIHIQLIHCIQDIEKILIVHINNIVYEINNMLRTDSIEMFDLVGYISLQKNYEGFMKMAEKEGGSKEIESLFHDLLSKKQLRYFGDILEAPEFRNPAKPTDKERKQYETWCERAYTIIAILGTVRNALTHGNQSNVGVIYNFDSKPVSGSGSIIIKGCNNEAVKKARGILDDLYRSRVKRLNDNFINLANKDLIILFKILGADTEEKQRNTIRNYYDFVVLKTYKNIGVSIKKLRETMAQNEPDAEWIVSDEYSSVRQKLYRAVDFIILEYYREHEDYIERLVECLRSVETVSAKERIYKEEAGRLWKNIRNDVNNKIRPKMDGDYIAGIKEKVVIPDAIEAVKIPDTAHVFCEIIYLMTHFLDGKEINDLLTQLINKFENIAEFYNILKKEGLNTSFNEKYSVFEESKEIAGELRLINSFARMSEPSPKVKQTMMLEAAELLGYDGENSSLIALVDDMMKSPKGVKKDHGFRNFIINNVIESDRFKYLVRYGEPRKIRNLGKNEKVIKYVLGQIPDDQIRRYYRSYYQSIGSNTDIMRDQLADEIKTISFNYFSTVHQGNGGSNEEKIDKERKKSIVRLYLTVLYLLQKNLVYVNSRYYLAFFCLERDAAICDKEKYRFENASDKEKYANYAMDFINDESHSQKKRVREYLNKNFSNSDPWAVSTYRNYIDHLNTVRNAYKYIEDIKYFESYFELYHFLMQKAIKDQFDFDCNRESKREGGGKIISKEKINNTILEYFELVEKYGTYCKDFVKALNIPFAYNLPRYKNLSIKELFDRNDYHPEKAKEEFGI